MRKDQLGCVGRPQDRVDRIDDRLPDGRDLPVRKVEEVQSVLLDTQADPPAAAIASSPARCQFARDRCRRASRHHR